MPLAYEVIRYDRGPDDQRELTITSVIRDDHAIRINYEIVPPLVDPRFGPWAEAEDDLGNHYDDVGGAYGHDPRRDRTNGDLSMPLPANAAKQLTVRVVWTWDSGGSRGWDGGTHQLRIQLARPPED
jgi:hypothetical protein